MCAKRAMHKQKMRRSQGTNGLYKLNIEGSHRIPLSIESRFQRHLIMHDVIERESHGQNQPPAAQDPQRIEDLGCLSGAGEGYGSLL